MLPKITDKTGVKDMVAYHNFTREIMSRKISENNISKLKLIKQFLDDEQFQPKMTVLKPREHRNSELVDRSSDLQRLKIENTEQK